MKVELPEWISHCGDALEVLSHLPDDSVDAIITDPPSGIGVMGYEWDSNKGGRDQWITWLAEIFVEARRVLRAGGFAVVWAIPKTSHWTATAVENAGFTIHDVVHHVFGNGLPKVKGVRATQEEIDAITALGRTIEGKGTQLKPSTEHWIIARKPLDVSSVAKELIKFGTGAMNIDACRIGLGTEANGGRHPANVVLCHSPGCKPVAEQVAARGMAGVDTDWDCVEGCPVAIMDAMSGISGGTKSTNGVSKEQDTRRTGGYHGGWTQNTTVSYADVGGASRYFAQFVWTPDMDELIFQYINKPSSAERHAGTDALEAGIEDVTWRDDINEVKRTEIAAMLSDLEIEPFEVEPITTYKLENIPPLYVVYFKPINDDGENGALRNTHPTVKPVSLIRYFVRLFVPPGGMVVDFFAGSGTTGVACIMEGRDCILIELEDHNVDIINARCKHAIELYGSIDTPVIVRRTSRKRLAAGTISMEDMWSAEEDDNTEEDCLDEEAVPGEAGVHIHRGACDDDHEGVPGDIPVLDELYDSVVQDALSDFLSKAREDDEAPDVEERSEVVGQDVPLDNEVLTEDNENPEEEQAMEQTQEGDKLWETLPVAQFADVTMFEVTHSSNVNAIGYDQVSRTLVIVYKGNRAYWFKGFPFTCGTTYTQPMQRAGRLDRISTPTCA